MMDDTNARNMDRHDNPDPLGLRDLPLVDPPADGWAGVRQALEADRRSARNRRFGAGLAAAACLVLVAGVTLFERGDPTVPDELATTDTGATSAQNVLETGEETLASAEPAYDSVGELIAMSQGLERRLRTLRDNTVAMPAESAVYLAELEDLIARVDSQLSDEPASVTLWSQRVNLLLDLETLFQHQFEREYGRMASL